MSHALSLGVSKPRAVRLLSLAIITSLVAAILVPLTAVREAEAWSIDPAVNTPICTEVGDQDMTAVTSDGSGGAIIVWQDTRNGLGIYAQRVNSSGTPQWTTNGVPICTPEIRAAYPGVVGDGSGGAIITWMDGRWGDVDIYAQRLNASGVSQWTHNGVPVCQAVNNQSLPGLIADESGGAVVAWTDNRTGDWDVYAQRISSSGAPLWTEDGVAVCASLGDQILTGGDGDGSGGVILAWQDGRGGDYDVYARRVSSSGAPLWTSDGVAVCTAVGGQALPLLLADGSGGAILTWTDERGGIGGSDVYVQKVNSSGESQWADDGVAVCTSAGSQLVSTLASDGSGGAVVAWTDLNVGNGDVYAQRVGSSGAMLWTGNGVPVGTGTGNQSMPEMVEDGSGGTIIAWADTRNGNGDIYAQRLDASGAHEWAENGVAICTAGDEQGSLDVVPDGSGGVVIVWGDRRNGGNSDIYAQRVNSGGGFGAPPNRPVNSAPLSGAAVGSTPTLQASVFDDPDTADGHSASQWRVTAASGDYSTPAFDSDSDSTNLRQIAVPSGRLNVNTTYYWQVRYRDNQGDWSPWSAETSFATRNSAPNRPTNASPPSGAAAVALTTTLKSSAFSDPDIGDSLKASQWRITLSAGDYTDPVFDQNGDGASRTEIVLLSGELNSNTTYYWQVRHQDSHGEWSDWSAETSFVTQNCAPNAPSAASPGAGATGMSVTPVLQSSAFSDPDAGETHTASQWQITANAGGYSAPVFDSGQESANLIELTVPSGKLKGNTTYYWRVRYQDSHGSWSAWSAEASFTTQKESLPWIWIVVGAAAALAFVGAVATLLVVRIRRNAAMLESDLPEDCT